DRIKDLVGADTVAGARLVLTNAIYFKGDWDIPFKEQATTEGTFFVTAEKQVKARLMHHTEHFGFAAVTPKDGPAFTALEMEYAGHNLAMLVLLPALGELDKLEAKLDAELIDDVVKQLGHEEVIVTLPRFKMEDSIALNKALQGVGIARAFDPERADFSGISSKAGLYISAVLHKAFVEVNEKGTEAAAGTGVALTSHRESPPAEFKADHPFVFIIRDKGSGAILFLGRVMDPAK
ncbi:MAG: serpin family protein, partial [Phycisphaerae bacterium]